jgi:type IV pilus assembly protein PilC
MQTYRWKGIDANGKSQSGKQSALSPVDLKASLLTKNIALLSCKKQISYNLIPIVLWQNNVSQESLESFFEQTGMLLECGVALDKSLQLFLNNSTSQSLNRIIRGILSDVESGNSLSYSMQKQKSIFPKFVYQIVDAGEKAGQINSVLKKIAQQIHEQILIKKELKKALLLPAITFVVAISIVAAILIFIVPQFQNIFNILDREIPQSTQTILSISEFIRSKGMIFAAMAVAILIVFTSIFLKTKQAKKLKDLLVLKVWFLNKIIVLKNLTIFFQTLTMSVSSGMTIKNGLIGAISTIKNSVIKSKVSKVVDSISSGESLATAFDQVKPKYISEKTIALIDVGEQTGNMAVMMNKISINLGQELKNKTDFLLTILQPIFIIIVGIIIAGLMLAIYVPIFNLANSL